jgi:hypothetical protein
MPFCWEEDAGAEAEGVVVAADVSRHSRQAGFEGPTFVSRGFWVRFVGDGTGQESRLLAILKAAASNVLNPSKADEDGTTVLFGLHAKGVGRAEVVCVMGAQRTTRTLMLWGEFAHRPTGKLRVRVVAEDATVARA